MSTNDLFKKIIEREIELDSTTHFFLSTDSKETEEMILNSYPGLIFVQNNKSFDRSKTENAKDAFVDLLCLSRVKKNLWELQQFIFRNCVFNFRVRKDNC